MKIKNSNLKIEFLQKYIILSYEQLNIFTTFNKDSIAYKKINTITNGIN